MIQLSKLIVILCSFAFLAACAAAPKNEYGIPAGQWSHISKQEQDIVKSTNQKMTFDEDNDFADM